MDIIHHYKDFAATVSSHAGVASSIVVVGNFDGFHRGHMSLWTYAHELMRSYPDHCLVALTFYPHPRVFFKALLADDLYFDESQKQRALHELGVHVHVRQRFDDRFAALSGEGFMEQVLVQGLRARHVVVGDDFCFAKDRSWDSHKMKSALQAYEVECHIRPHQRCRNGQVISSSLMRRLGKRGDMSGLADCLGRWPMLEGPCVVGRGLGKRLLYPTANIRLGRRVPLLAGVYIALVHIYDQEPELGTSLLVHSDAAATHYGVVNLGQAPSMASAGAAHAGAIPWLEVHLLDWVAPPQHESFAGQFFRVRLLEFVRREQSFATVEELQQQISQDIATTHAWLRQHAQEGVSSVVVGPEESPHEAV